MSGSWKPHPHPPNINPFNGMVCHHALGHSWSLLYANHRSSNVISMPYMGLLLAQEASAEQPVAFDTWGYRWL